MQSQFQWCERFSGWMALALVLMANNPLRGEPCPASVTCAPPARMIPPPPTSFQVGHSIALEGDVAVVGSPYMRCATLDRWNCGAAHVFRLVNGEWSLQMRLIPDDEPSTLHTAYSVATNGEFVAVSASEDDGACGPNSDCGAVYVFRNTGNVWYQAAKLTAPDGEPGDSFGVPVAMSGNVLIAGALSDCADGANCGAAYVFRHDGFTWQFEQKLQSSLLHQNSAAVQFSVDVDENVIAIGVPYLWDPTSESRGGVLTYRFNGVAWVEETLLSDNSWGNRFGIEVDVAENRIAVVSPGEGGYGAVFLYNRQGANWVQSDVLMPAPQWPDDGFGLSRVGIDNDLLLVSAPFAPCGMGPQCGLVHVFRQDGGSWSQVAAIRGRNDSQAEQFGKDLAIHAGRFVVGGPGAFRSTQDFFPSGAGYFFDSASLGCDCAAASCAVTLASTSDCNENARMDDCELEGRDCNGNLRHDACDLRFGGSSDGDSNGIPDECGCLTVAPIAAETAGLDKSRFISFVPGNPGHNKAIRVILRSLHHVNPPYGAGPTVVFTAFEGQVRWVGPPSTNLESTTPGDAQFVGAGLQCEPHFQDWSTIDVLHVMGSGIVPNSEYEVQIVGANCNLDQEDSYSLPLLLRTTRWGDVEFPYSPPSPTTQPDITDVSVLVNKFKSTPGAPIKARALLAGNDEFGNIIIGVDLDFSHISACVDAFRGRPYPYTVQSCP